MELVANILLVAGALGAGLYCFVLARRLNRFNDLEKGVGGAVAVLSAQVDDLNRTLNAAREVSEGSGAALKDLTGRAETVAQRLELLMASMHDMPVAESATLTPGSNTQGLDTPSSDLPARPTTATEPDGPIFVRHDRPRQGARQ